MATALEFDEHLAGLATAMQFGAVAARRAGPDAAVPTCPEWTVRQLIAHTGKVHRWAAAQLLGKPDEIADAAATEYEGLAAADPVQWWEVGAVALAATLTAAPDDLEALVFLADAPPPRRFWARRQCHETTIHAVDAVAAALGRRPAADEVTDESGAVAISDRLALDGIDELAMGFLQRRRSRLRRDRLQRLWIHPLGDVGSWVVEIGPDAPVTTAFAPGATPTADEELTGTPVGMYLSLWNRADELDGDAAARQQWSELTAI